MTAEQPVAQGGLAYVRALDCADIPATAHHLGVWLETRADNATGEVRPVSLNGMAAATKMGKSTVQRAALVLERAGLLRIDRASKAKQQRDHEVNRLTLTIPPNLARRARSYGRSDHSPMVAVTTVYGQSGPRAMVTATHESYEKTLMSDAASLADARYTPPPPAVACLSVGKATVRDGGGSKPGVVVKLSRPIDDDVEDGDYSDVIQDVQGLGDWDMFGQQEIHLHPAKGYDPEGLLLLVADKLRSKRATDVLVLDEDDGTTRYERRASTRPLCKVDVVKRWSK